MTDDHHFTDEILITPAEFVRLATMTPLPAVEVQCELSRPMYEGADRWCVREDGTLTFWKCVPQLGGGSEYLPPQPSMCDPAEVRTLLQEVVEERLWLYAEADDAWDDVRDFDSPDELRLYVFFPGRRFVAGRASGEGLAPVLRLSLRLWALFPLHRRPAEQVVTRVG